MRNAELQGLARNGLHLICHHHHGAHAGQEQKLLSREAVLIYEAFFRGLGGGGDTRLTLAPQLVGWVDFSGSEGIPAEEFQRR